MNGLFPLPIFPEGSLASSVVTTVWIGVVVSCVMNLRLGWTFSGLVVPGYLVPLMMVKPWAAIIVLIQAVIVYGVVRFSAWAMPRANFGCAFFGRDRFFAMIIVSVVVRLISDGWLLPNMGAWMVDAWDLEFDYETNLHSFGLIVVSLTANQFWKSGLVRGAIPFLFNLAVTWFLVRIVLMEFTNFSITNLAFLYEDIASNIEASPKAYIVMITTSIIASRMNLKYGWDFNGIMIPALLALQWYEPLKILTSVVEAIIILKISVWLMKTRWFQSVTMEGARKMLLFFTVSFAFKLAMGHAIGLFDVNAKVSDFYGFGYLLPTLMAMKMHELKSILRQVGITIQISLVSVVVANVLGFSLTLLPESWRESGNKFVQAEEIEIPRDTHFAAYLDQRIQNMYTSSLVEVPKPPDLRHLLYLERGIGRLIKYRPGKSKKYLNEGVHMLRVMGMEAVIVDKRFLVASSLNPEDGYGIYVIDFKSKSDLSIQCPYPFDEAGSLESAIWLFEKTGAKSLGIGAIPKEAGRLNEGDVLLDRESLFHRFHLAAGRKATIQVRISDGDHSIRVKGTLPDDLKLKLIEENAGSYRLNLAPGSDRNVQRENCKSHFVEWLLDRKALETLFAGTAPPEAVEPQVIFQPKMLPEPAPEGSNAHRPMELGELLRFESTVIRPSLELNQESEDLSIRYLANRAAPFGYRLDRFGDLLVLAESGPDFRHSISLVLNLSPKANPISIEVPSRSSGNGGLNEFSYSVFQRLNARAMLVAGNHRLANSDGSSEFTRGHNLKSLFNLSHQAILGSAPDSPWLVLQFNAFAIESGDASPVDPILISPFFEHQSHTEVLDSLAPIESLLERDGIPFSYASAEDPITAQYQLGLNLQAKFLDHIPEGTFATIWLSPDLRNSFRSDGESPIFQTHLRALEIETERQSVSDFLKEYPLEAQESDSIEALKDLARSYRNEKNIVLLQRLRDFPGVEMKSLLEPEGSHPLILFTRGGETVLGARLSSPTPDSTTEDPETFLQGRAAWLKRNPQPSSAK